MSRKFGHLPHHIFVSNIQENRSMFNLLSLKNRNVKRKTKSNDKWDWKPPICVKTSEHVCHRSLCPSLRKKIKFIWPILPQLVRSFIFVRACVCRAGSESLHLSDKLVSLLVGALSPVNHRGLHQGYLGQARLFVSWCFEPSQPQRITSGLPRTSLFVC